MNKENYYSNHDCPSNYSTTNFIHIETDKLVYAKYIKILGKRIINLEKKVNSKDAE